ncbi:ATP-binding protein [Seleniivibrio sp.]|uniref:ATP-binding protein n=1 Tax=Seleniivibrio sp. TaxID=2898801 RepID=UPI0025FD995C|nr:ATP-binding protein [Seleniivibrio sp.]
MKKLFAYAAIFFMAVILSGNALTNNALRVFFKNEVLETNVFIGETPMEMFTDILQKMSAKERREYISEYTNRHGYPLEIVNLSEIPADERAAVMNGSVVTNMEGDLFKKRIPGSDDVFILGPFKIRQYGLYLLVMANMIAISFIFLCTFFFVFYIWKEMEKIGKAASAFGRGDFSYRIKAGRATFIKPIAAIFNDMAQRTSDLISSHRDLTNALAHELKTPIACMKFEIEKLASSVPDTEALNGIRKDSERLESLISSMLTYARLNRREDFTSVKNINVCEWVHDYAGTVAGQVETVADESCKDVFINADEKLINIAVNNLVGNSLKYSGTKAELSVRCVDGDVIIAVNDRGPGLDKDTIDKLFKPFYRPDGQSAEGQGLGLAIVKKIAELHGGTVTAKNREGGGASFSLILRSVSVTI